MLTHKNKPAGHWGLKETKKGRSIPLKKVFKIFKKWKCTLNFKLA